MAIQSITKAQFYGFGVQRAPFPPADEREFYRNDKTGIIGTIVYDKGDKDFACIILDPAMKPVQPIHVQSCFDTLEEAKTYIGEKMLLSATELDSL
jgi:hypothetical protein